MSKRSGSSIRKKIVFGYMRIYCFISFMLFLIFMIAVYLVSFYVIREYVKTDIEKVFEDIIYEDSLQEMYEASGRLMPEYIIRYDFIKESRKIKEEDYYTSASYGNVNHHDDDDSIDVVFSLVETQATSSDDSSPQVTPNPVNEENISDENKPTAGYITSTYLYIRQRPDTDSSIIYKAYYGTEVLITEDLGDWYKIWYDDKELYCASRFISLGNAPSPTPPPGDSYWDAETAHLFSNRGVNHSSEASYDRHQEYSPFISLEEPYLLYSSSYQYKYIEMDGEDYVIEERYIYKAVTDIRKIIPYDVIWAAVAFSLSFILVLFFIGLIIIWGYGASKTKKYLKPIDDITNLAGQIQPNSLYRLNVNTAKYELKELVITINNMLDRLSAAHIKRKKFVSDVSHELRTPISVVAGYANMLKRWAKDDEAVFDESVDAIIEEASNMKYLVENLLFLARSDNDQNVYEMEPFDISAMIDSIYKDAKMVDGGAHDMRSEIEDGVIVNGDRNRLKQTIREFLLNAVKYTPDSGKIKISLKKEETKAIINITDTGIGISKKDMGHIFTRFYRGDESRNRNAGGYGLGLSICREIISAHDGKIMFKSKENFGTSVTVELKLG